MLLSANTISDHCNDMINLRVKKSEKVFEILFYCCKSEIEAVRL